MEEQSDEELPYLSVGGEYAGNQAIEKGLDTRYKHRPRLHRLKDAKRGLEAKLAEINKAIELLEANPQINEIMEAVERAGI